MKETAKSIVEDALMGLHDQIADNVDVSMILDELNEASSRETQLQDGLFNARNELNAISNTVTLTIQKINTVLSATLQSGDNS